MSHYFESKRVALAAIFAVFAHVATFSVVLA